jgi:hypothetical protein
LAPKAMFSRSRNIAMVASLVPDESFTSGSAVSLS